MSMSFADAYLGFTLMRLLSEHQVGLIYDALDDALVSRAGVIFSLWGGFGEDLIRGLNPGERGGAVVPLQGEAIDGVG